MPAAISVPMQTKIIDLYEKGSKLKDIAQTVTVGRNAVARIVQAHIDKNAAAPQTIADAEFTNLQLHKLKYLVRRQVSHGDCPKCSAPQRQKCHSAAGFATNLPSQ